MKIFWETQCWAGSSIVPTGISCLTWMPHVPKHHVGNPSHITAFHGVQPSETRGFLAIGTESGVVGVTVTDTAEEADFEELDLSRRYNYNLRGHHSRIQRCAWNATMTKLMSCDVNGIIYFWVPNDERWSVELVNDRGPKVRDFHWMPNGQAVLIVYEDNFFIIVGSANGQRIWTHNFLYQINCGAWAPSSKEFVLGLENGHIQVFTEHGTLITERQILQCGIQRVAFSAVREDLDQKWTLAVVSATDHVLFINTFYEVELRSWQSCDPIKSIQWSTNGHYLAVVCKTGNIVILNHECRPIHSFTPPIQITDDSISFTWAHNDETIITASGGSLAVGRVETEVPRLSKLIAYQMWLSLGRTARDVDRLGLPQRPSNVIRQFDRHIVRCRIPSYERMCRFVCEPTFWRWYCTIIPRKNFHYMLCVEHMGGLIPILIGRQINRVIPQFVISLPPSTAFSVPGYSRGRFAVQSGEHQVGPPWDFASIGNPNLPIRNSAFTSDLEVAPSATIDDPVESGFASTVGMEFCSMEEALTHGTTTATRNTMWRRSKRRIKKFVGKRLATRSPKASRMLCHVRSNVWCTRFKITSPGIRDLPDNLAQVVYKTSVLHLQPRQMTISLCDLRPLTKTLPLDPNAIQSISIPMNNPIVAFERTQEAVRRYRSPDNSPAIPRHLAQRTTARMLATDDGIGEQMVGQGVVSPVDTHAPLIQNHNGFPLPALYNPQLHAPHPRMTYAETRARLRERRPIQRVPVSQREPAATGTAAAQNGGGRARRSALRYFRRQAAEPPATNQEPAQQRAARTPEAPVDEDEDLTTSGAQSIGTERHVRFSEQAEGTVNEQATLLQRNELEEDSELLEEERRLYATVLAEFRGLRSAIGDHVSRMRNLANELELPQPQTSSASKSKPTTEKTVDEDVATSSSTGWQNRLDSLEFIDDDENSQTLTESQQAATTTRLEDRQLLVTSTKREEKSNVVANSLTKKQRTSSRLLDRTLIDRLANLAADLRLTRRAAKKQPAKPAIAAVENSETESTDDEDLEYASNDLRPLISVVDEAEKETSVNDEPNSNPSVDDMRQQFRHIARQLALIEEALRPTDMFADLQQRVQTLKSTLGESTHAADLIEPSRGFVRPSNRGSQSARLSGTLNAASFQLDDVDSLEVQSERGASPASLFPNYETIKMSNKTPYWNEESQVYQLDFGGRVTQESAKNFQIEHDYDQVMQFGRIENGCYTLDFCSPLSAVQAFGIALASITQRLK
ncbi:Tubby-related protein 4 [Aphelenchoides besseyi]|nr:Tubby-related protein 4 [Aphelenchoides besseyi]